jgi:protein arginine kinase activator
MQFCSVCQKAPATTVIMDLTGGNVTEQRHLCAACAEKLGFVHQKTQIKMSPELLEDLLGSIQGKTKGGRRDSACPGCGMTLQHFKSTGRLGCARCYETFRQELMPLLQRVHEASSHRGRMPGRAPEPERAAQDGLVDLRRRLDDAVRGERYEEAARLRDELRRAESGSES